MRLGIFAKTFVRPTLEETLDAVKAHGLDCVQFNMSCAGLASLPDEIDPELCDRIRREMASRNITMSAVSGTFNMIHPDLQQRQDGLRRLRLLIEAAPRMGTQIITLCTGTRDPENMWRGHPDNLAWAAWGDLMNSLQDVLPVAEKAHVLLAVEPEPNNVVNDLGKAMTLVVEIKPFRVGFVLDLANLVGPADIGKTKAILGEAFFLCSDLDYCLAHAKDVILADTGTEVKYVAAGKGCLDYDHYLKRIQNERPNLGLILHGLDESEVDGCVKFIRAKISALPGA
jgi:sugar phosphate isomerase/epimerase